MTISELALWPGTKISQYLGIDPTSDAGLTRWMINTVIYLAISLTIVVLTVT